MCFASKSLQFVCCRNSGAPDNYVNTYQCPLDTKEVGATVHMQWTGYFTYSQIHRLFDELRYAL
jgi:hypothetical protein